VIIFPARNRHFSSHCYVSICLASVTQRLCKRGAMLSVCFKNMKTAAATCLSKILPSKLSLDLQGHLWRWRGKESQHSSSAREHQLLVFPELQSFCPPEVLLSPFVTVIPECSGSSATVLRCGRPVTAGRDKHWAPL